MKTINHAQSYDRGIICYSNIVPIAGVYTYFDSQGKIRKKEVFLSEITLKNESENNDKFLLEGEPEFMLKYVIFEILYILTAFTGDIIYFFVLSFFLSWRTFSIYETFFKCARQFKSKDGLKRNLSKIHGAEHKAVNAYVKKQKIPSVADVKKMSRYSKDCGTLRFFNRVFQDTFLSLLMIFLYYLAKAYMFKSESTAYLIFLIGIIIFMAVLFSKVLKTIEKNGFLKFMEYFVTDEPDLKEIELAIKAIENFEKFENDLKCNNNEHFKIIFYDDFVEIR